MELAGLPLLRSAAAAPLDWKAREPASAWPAQQDTNTASRYLLPLGEG